MTKKLLSIIVPVHNSAAFLIETLQSILKQDYENIEVIVVDDGSTDNSIQIIKKISSRDNRIKVFQQENAGPSAARNKAIIEAKGQFILPVDSDDVLSPDYVKLCMAEFKKNPSIKLVYGSVDYFGDKTGKWELPLYSFQHLLQENIIHCSAIFKRKDAIESGLYDEKLKKGFEDWDFWLRLLNNEDKIVYVKEAVLKYRIREDSRNKKILSNVSDTNKTLNRILINNIIKYNYSNVYEIYCDLKNKENYIDKLHNKLSNLQKNISYLEILKLFIKKLIKYNTT
jgi:glycosyltransferase involved in cell wall biosynthesis